MSLTLGLLAVVAAWTVGYFVYGQVILHRKRYANGCEPATHASPWDPVLGLKHAMALQKAMRERRNLEHFEGMFKKYGNTFEVSLLGNPMHFTCEPENIQAILATKFADWDMGPRRKRATFEFVGVGIFSADGKDWVHARTMARPQLTRSYFADVAVWEAHLQSWFQAMKEQEPGGKPIEMQEWTQRYTLDVGTELLSGRSLGVLHADRAHMGRRFLWALDRANNLISERLRAGKLSFLVKDPNLNEARGVLHEHIDPMLHEAIASHKSGVVIEDAKYTLPRALAAEGIPLEQIRDHVLNLLLAAVGSEASLIITLFFVVAKYPIVQERLRREIEETVGRRTPEYEEIKNMRYLNWVIKETLRMYPPVPQNLRVANKDTVLPVGGGPDGRSPVFIAKGRECSFSSFSLQRRRDLWGEDALEFKPERWEKERPTWNYIPFSGGPRICLGQQLALVGGGYTLVRFMQQYSVFKAPNPNVEWQEKLNITCFVNNGVQVILE
ncbi:cytochrome P450 [Xylariaceae sp. FL1272]|nr:cytochrome P450 [Xylariaceae sp. FL1272]